METWLASRPPHIQAMAKKFPMDSVFLIYGVKHYLLGYTEDEMLILSSTPPNENYEKAIETKIFVHALHFELWSKNGGSHN